jgi:hypothetical protein
MKTVLIFLFIVHFYTICAQEFGDYPRSDSISIELNELMDIDYRFKIIFDDFIDNIPSNCQNLKETSILNVGISANTTFVPTDSLINSLYQYNEFEKGIYTFPYKVFILPIFLETNMLHALNGLKNCFYIYYRGYNIIIEPMFDLSFPWVGNIITKKYFLSNQETFFPDCFSTYRIGDYDVEKIKYIKLFSQPFGIPLKDKYFKDRAKSDSLRYSK